MRLFRIVPALVLGFALLPIAYAAAPPTLPVSAPAPVPLASVAERSKQLSDLFAAMWAENLKDNPEFASTLGIKTYDDQLTDYSVEAINAQLARGRQNIQELSEIDTTGLSDQEKLSVALMLNDLISAQEGARFKEWEMPATQFDSFFADLARLVPQLSFDNEADYTHYIARLRQVPRVFSQNMTNMMLGMDDGRVPPAYLLQKMLVQVQTLANQKPEDSPFALPIKNFPAGISPEKQKQITADVLDAISTQVLPSFQRFAKFVAAQYIPAGRKDPGVWALPDGDAYYAYKVRLSTTLTKTPAEIHQIGLDEVAKDEAAKTEIAHHLGFADTKALDAAMKADPKLHPMSKQQLLDAYSGYLAVMQTKLPQLFGTLPQAKIEVQPIPEYLEKNQAPAYYEQGSEDGKRPGRVNVNTYDFANRYLSDVEVIAYHEGIPGHHLQISIAQELTGLPEFRKQEYYTAYTEGWGLYSEHLGKDIGLYQNPYNDYGRLNADEWRAARLVVDTGVHSEHWTRQQMVDYLHAHTALSDTDVNAEVDRYIALPAQALGYKMGQLKFLELRAKAQKELGAKFDIRGFHDTIIDAGAMPLDMVEQRVDAWIAANK
ncbi:MAG TPA: DUF885 domain-containing protein [Acidobacteriaceae bacterium]|nr:DUF885 domain-containing protein [Acidobacteriaceae bacterium]